MKVKAWKKIYYASIDHKKLGAAITNIRQNKQKVKKS